MVKRYRVFTKGFSKGDMSPLVPLNILIKGLMLQYKENAGSLTPDDILNHMYLMEGTGVLAHDGTEIFQDDVVQRYCNNPACNLNHKGVVVYEERVAQWYIAEDNREAVPLVIGEIKDGIIKSYGITKLGNIHENPELVDKELRSAILNG